MTIPPEKKPTQAWMLPSAMALLTFALFGDCLLLPGRVPGYITSDLRVQLLGWRQFAFSQIRAGHFPLWNPYAFCGTPFFADPQSAMLYPPNWLNLFLSPTRAASWLTAIHFFLAGFFTGRWCLKRGTSVPAAILGGAIYACCGPIITNIAAGHLPLLCSAAWAPLLLSSMEDICAPALSCFGASILTAIAAVALLALDGYPQFAYYSALAAALYALLLLPASRRPALAVAGVAIVFIAGWAIAAAQILAARQFISESVRAAGLTQSDAAAFSLPPENLLTLFLPGLFGDAVGLSYFGRWFWWETCLFIGPVALVMAILGIARNRRAIALAILAGVMLLLALGAYTPLFPLLFHYLPGFGGFRATARFGLLGVLCLSVLAAHGWDNLHAWADGRAAAPHPLRSPLILCIAILGAIFGFIAVYVRLHGVAGFTPIIRALAATHQSFELMWKIFPDFPAAAAAFVASQLAQAALITLLAAALLAAAVSATPPRRKTFLNLLAALALAQSVYFAFAQRATSDHNQPPQFNWQRAIAALPPDARVLATPAWFANRGSADDFLDIGGYNPLILSRTANYLAAVEYEMPDEAGQNDPQKVNNRLCRMLRGALVLPAWPGAAEYSLPDPLPHLLLLDHVAFVPSPEYALAAVLDTSFDPAANVVLESPPNPAPDVGGTGQAHLLRQSADELEIQADLTAAKVLLITDAYGTGWRAAPLDPGDHRAYQILPGDYMLRAIPLAAGHHHLLLKYQPANIALGKWISLTALALYLAAAITINWKR